MTNTEFITKVAKYVQKYAPQYDIKVCSPIIAQAILESGWGKSSLASKYHNYFGLKCGSAWKGKSVNLNTKEEYKAGTYTDIKANFRVYDSMEEGIKGYFEFIQYTRYANLKGITDPKKYLETIKADGYATSSKYVENNYKLITQYELTKYDKEVITMGKSRDKIVAQAKAWIGCKESDGSHKKIINLYNKNTSGYNMTYKDPWCACFASAVAIKVGYTDIIPTSVNCGELINKFKAKGAWVENDAYKPSPGDYIFYDWDDSCKGDNKGGPDHVGIVEKVSGSTITVIEGNKGNAVARRKIKVNGKYIRGYGVPKYDAKDSKPSKPSASTWTGVVTPSDGLNVRKGAGTDKAKIKAIAKGTKVTVTGSAKDADGANWYKIKVNNITGYVMGKYIKKA